MGAQALMNNYDPDPLALILMPFVSAMCPREFIEIWEANITNIGKSVRWNKIYSHVISILISIDERLTWNKQKILLLNIWKMIIQV